MSALSMSSFAALLDPPKRVPKVSPWLVAVIVSMATFMEVLDTSIANVALRYIAGGLGTSQDESSWTLTTYLVANAVILPVSGWLSTRIGRKRFYMLCVLLFTVSSAVCGMAPSLAVLLCARVAQGLGGGGLAPSEQAILTDTFSPKQRGAAFALYGVAVVVAPAIGPALGGWITDHYSWRWIFFMNIPVGALSLFLTWHFVPDPEDDPEAKKQKGKRIDYWGFGLFALGLGSLQVVLDRGQIDDWFGSGLILTFTIVAVLALLFGVLHEMTTDDPVVDLPLLIHPSFAISNVCMFGMGMILYGTTQLLPQMTQDLFGYDATTAGLTVSPGGFVILALTPLVGFMVSRVQPKYIIVFGFFMQFVACSYCTNYDLQTSYAKLVFGRCLQTFSLAFLFTPINTIAYSGLPKGKSNNASALINLMRNYGGSVGIAITQTLQARRSAFHQNRINDHLSPGNPNLIHYLHTPGASYGKLYGSVAQQSSIFAYVDIFKVFAVLSLVAMVAACFLKRVDPNEKSAGGH